MKIMYVILPYLDREKEAGTKRWVTAVLCNNCHVVRALSLEIKRSGRHQSIANQVKCVGAW